MTEVSLDDTSYQAKNHNGVTVFKSDGSPLSLSYLNKNCSSDSKFSRDTVPREHDFCNTENSWLGKPK